MTGNPAQQQNNKNLVIPLLGAPGTALSGTDLLSNLTDAEVQYKTVSMLLERFRPDGIFPIMDLTVEAEALGMEISFPQDENPSVVSHPIKDLESLAQLQQQARQGNKGRMEIFTTVAGRLAKNYPDTLIGAYVIGPFTLAGELMGVSDLITNAVLDPDLVQRLVDFCLDYITPYAKAFFAAGAKVVAVLEPTAVMLSPALYETFSLRAFRQLREALDKKPLILHICGNTKHIVPAMGRSGAMGLSLDSNVSLPEMRKLVPPEVALIGNIHPVAIFLNGTPEQVRAATLALKKEMAQDPNFILSSGCDLPPKTPLANIEAFMTAARA